MWITVKSYLENVIADWTKRPNSNVFTSSNAENENAAKGSPYSSTDRRVPELIQVLGSLQMT